MKLKKILKHMKTTEPIRIYTGNGCFINSIAGHHEIMQYMDKKVKCISSGKYADEPTICISLEDKE